MIEIIVGIFIIGVALKVISGLLATANRKLEKNDINKQIYSECGKLGMEISAVDRILEFHGDEVRKEKEILCNTYQNKSISRLNIVAQAIHEVHKKRLAAHD
jgi:hypothetical protein